MDPIHIFDVDDTIIKNSTGIHFLLYGLKHRIFSIGSLLKMPIFAIQYRRGVFDEKVLSREISFIKGLPLRSLEEVAARCFHERIRYGIYQDAFDQIRSLLNMGIRVIFATSSIDLIVKPLGEHFGVHEIICSKFEFIDGICTGRLDGSAAFGKNKQYRVKEYIENSGAALSDCSFYTDSIYDLPLLQQVHTPIVVNPDRKLKKVARKNGWKEIIYNKRIDYFNGM